MKKKSLPKKVFQQQDNSLEDENSNNSKSSLSSKSTTDTCLYLRCFLTIARSNVNPKSNFKAIIKEDREVEEESEDTK